MKVMRRQRQTSIDIYHRIKAEGLLNRMENLVYNCIFEHGPLTIKETCLKLPHIPETSISPTFARLEKRDAIFTEIKRPCRITGNNVHEWDVTGRAPIKVTKEDKIKCPTCKGTGHLKQGRLF